MWRLQARAHVTVPARLTSARKAEAQSRPAISGSLVDWLGKLRWLPGRQDALYRGLWMWSSISRWAAHVAGCLMLPAMEATGGEAAYRGSSFDLQRHRASLALSSLASESNIYTANFESVAGLILDQTLNVQ
jgi:hypothetical protein